MKAVGGGKLSRMGHQHAAEPKRGAHHCTTKRGGALHCTTKSLGGLGRPVLGCSRNSYEAYLVMQNRNLEYGERRCGLNTNHQITTKGHNQTHTKTPPKHFGEDDVARSHYGHAILGTLVTEFKRRLQHALTLRALLPEAGPFWTQSSHPPTTVMTRRQIHVKPGLDIARKVDIRLPGKGKITIIST